MQIIQSSLLNNFTNLTQGFSTRINGNLAFHVDDKIKNVQTNHTLLAKGLNYDKRTLVHMKQIHSNIVHLVDKNDNFESPKRCDALITNKKHTPLMVMVADCTPILFYDEKQKVIAVAHAGRQGAFKNIVKNVCDSFRENFQSKRENILVSVGAHIKSCCYEVGAEIFKETQELNLEYAIRKRKNSYYLDIDKILKQQLLACGIKNENIEFCSDCTCCKSDKYFSYRADRVTGRFCGIIFLK